MGLILLFVEFGHRLYVVKYKEFQIKKFCVCYTPGISDYHMTASELCAWDIPFFIVHSYVDRVNVQYLRLFDVTHS